MQSFYSFDRFRSFQILKGAFDYTLDDLRRFGVLSNVLGWTLC